MILIDRLFTSRWTTNGDDYLTDPREPQEEEGEDDPDPDQYSLQQEPPTAPIHSNVYLLNGQQQQYHHPTIYENSSNRQHPRASLVILPQASKRNAPALKKPTHQTIPLLTLNKVQKTTTKDNKMGGVDQQQQGGTILLGKKKTNHNAKPRDAVVNNRRKLVLPKHNKRSEPLARQGLMQRSLYE